MTDEVQKLLIGVGTALLLGSGATGTLVHSRAQVRETDQGASSAHVINYLMDELKECQDGATE